MKIKKLGAHIVNTESNKTICASRKLITGVFETTQMNQSLDLPYLNNAKTRKIEEYKVMILDQNAHKRFWQKESAERDIKDLIDEKKVLLELEAFFKNRLRDKLK